MLSFNGTPKDVPRMVVSLDCILGRTILLLLPNCLTSTAPLPVFN
jgi:hypothetical protein